MKFTAEQIANALNGKVEGNNQVEVYNLSKIEEGKTGSLSFLANPKYTSYIYDTQASIVIVNSDFQATKPIYCTLIRVADAYTAFSQVLEMYNQVKLNKSGVSAQSAISLTAKLGENIYVGEFVFIGDNVIIGDNVKIYPQSYVGDNCTIGENTTLFPGVKIYSDCIIGKNCTFHAGVVIGSDGFGFAPQSDSNYKKVAQIGNVIIEDNVEIGSNSTIDRATLGSTIIRNGVKLDNLIQIAHNVEIGENTVMAALSGVSGSTKIGKNCMIGGQVGMSGHIKIGDNVKIGAQAGVIGNIKDGVTIIGSPAIDAGAFMKSSVYFKKLPEMAQKLNNIEKKLNSE